MGIIRREGESDDELRYKIKLYSGVNLRTFLEKLGVHKRKFLFVDFTGRVYIPGVY